MRLSRVFFLTMGFFLILSAMLAINRQAGFLMAGENGKLDQQIQQIDQEIAELEDMKRGYEARAIRHENLGQMMQTDSEYTLETRRHYQIAEQNREIAAKIQVDIDQLQAKKQALLKQRKGS